MRKRTNLSKYREKQHKEHREKYALLERCDKDIESMIGWESGRQSQMRLSKQNQTRMEYRIACLRQAMVSLNDYTIALRYVTRIGSTDIDECPVH